MPWRIPDYREYPSCEDIPVTFQVGMVGSDGVLLASDMKARSTAGQQEGISAGVDFPSTAEKLFHYDRHAYCIAGNDNTIRWIANGVHERFEKQGSAALDSEAVRSLLWDAVNEICKPRVDQFGNPGLPLHYRVPGTMLLAYRGHREVELWRIDLTGFGPGVYRVFDKTLQGDAANSAAFFLLRYYRVAPINQLLPLAAHCILTAAKVNPSGVEGLEIVVSTLEGTTKLNEQERSRLIEASEKLDAAIYQHISQLTYKT